MRKDVGVDGDAQRIGQLVWMLFMKIFDAIRELMAPPEKPHKKIGFDIKERQATYGGKSRKRRASQRK